MNTEIRNPKGMATGGLRRVAGNLHSVEKRVAFRTAFRCVWGVKIEVEITQKSCFSESFFEGAYRGVKGCFSEGPNLKNISFTLVKPCFSKISLGATKVDFQSVFGSKIMSNQWKNVSEKTSFFVVVFRALFCGFWDHFGSNKSPDFQEMERRRHPFKQRRFGNAFWIVLGVFGGWFWLIFEPLEVKIHRFWSQWGVKF